MRNLKVPGVIVVTSCDAAHHYLVSELLESLAAAGPRAFRIGFVQVGPEPLPPEIRAGVDIVVRAEDDVFLTTGLSGYRLAYLAIKARLPEFFPDFDIHVWLDGDTWIQHRRGLGQIVQAAQQADLAIHPELDPNYWQTQFPDNYTLTVYHKLYGADDALRYARAPMCNSGVFGARANSKVWGLWREALADVRNRAVAAEHDFLSDQIPLHRLIASGQLSICPLRAANNWLVGQSPPGIDLERKRLLAPTFPYEEINIIHLAGRDKAKRYPIGDSGRDICFRYSEVKALMTG